MVPLYGTLFQDKQVICFYNFNYYVFSSLFCSIAHVAIYSHHETLTFSNEILKIVIIRSSNVCQYDHVEAWSMYKRTLFPLAKGSKQVGRANGRLSIQRVVMIGPIK